MVAHNCAFSIMRFEAQYRGNPYELNECEGCGALRLTRGPELGKRIVSPGSAEFEDVLGFLEFMITRAAQMKPLSGDVY